MTLCSEAQHIVVRVRARRNIKVGFQWNLLAGRDVRYGQVLSTYLIGPLSFIVVAFRISL